jgi:fructokinase
MPERQRIPEIAGTGFVALDVVINGLRPQGPRLWAGGTCGNVLAISGFLGWRSSAIARLSDDPAGQCVLDDLKRWNVDACHAQLEPKCSTPIVVQEITKTKSGIPVHRFLWTCPGCGAYYPGFRPVTIKAVRAIQPKLRDASVFFFDRVSPGILDIARYYARKGSLIFFEPSGSGDPRLFQEALRLTHVLKYSHQRVRSFADLMTKSFPPLQIETLGEDGLRYRCNLPGISSSGWRLMGSFEVPVFKDSAGSGDWCSAGIISVIGANGVEGLSSLSLDGLTRALRFGQALAAWNCGFEGARGGMYAVAKSAFKKSIAGILAGRTSRHPTMLPNNGEYKEDLSLLCPNCELPTTNRAKTQTRSVVLVQK